MRCKLFTIIMFLVLLVPIQAFAGTDKPFPPGPVVVRPAPGGGGTINGPLAIGSSAVVEGVEYRIAQHNMVNSDGNTIFGWFRTMEITDVTADTEDCDTHEYLITGGSYVEQ